MPVISSSLVSFEGLKNSVAQAKAALDQVYQIASALEGRATRQAQPGTSASGESPAVQGQQPQGAVATPVRQQPITATDLPSTDTQQESFEDSIAEMRRIAGIK
jgi:type II secretory pathway pseudopilin PulG